MKKNNIKIIFLTLIFYNQLTLSVFSMNNEEDRQLGQPHLKKLCELCWENTLRKNARERNLSSSVDGRLLSVCKSCYDKQMTSDKKRKKEEKAWDEHHAREFANFMNSQDLPRIQFTPSNRPPNRNRPILLPPE